MIAKTPVGVGEDARPIPMVIRATTLVPRITVRRRAASAEIEVTDAGPGIPAAERDRVFERFYRVEGDSTRGTGLGLSIAKAIVERHHGSIRLAEAHPGAALPGLAIQIELPTGDGMGPRSAEAAGLSVA